jgi:hypothetical protein
MQGKSDDGNSPNSEGFKRRDLLLRGTSLVAASALLSAGVAASAQAQQPASTAPTGKQPNILVIMADDVGIWNISAYHRGMMGGQHAQHRPDRQGRRAVHRLLRPAIVHGGRAAFITGQTPFRTGLLKVGMPAAKQGLQDSDPTIARVLLKPLRLRNGADRQEPSRRPQRISAHGARLRRVSTASSTTSTRWKSRTSRLPEGCPVPGAISAPATSWTPKRPASTIPLRIRAGARSASRRSPMAVLCRRIRTWIPKPKPTWRMSTTNWFAGPSISWTAP